MRPCPSNRWLPATQALRPKLAGSQQTGSAARKCVSRAQGRTLIEQDRQLREDVRHKVLHAAHDIRAQRALHFAAAADVCHVRVDAQRLLQGAMPKAVRAIVLGFRV
jgi:hypothetical protein